MKQTKNQAMAWTISQIHELYNPWQIFLNRRTFARKIDTYGRPSLVTRPDGFLEPRIGVQELRVQGWIDDVKTRVDIAIIFLY